MVGRWFWHAVAPTTVTPGTPSTLCLGMRGSALECSSLMPTQGTPGGHPNLRHAGPLPCPAVPLGELPARGGHQKGKEKEGLRRLVRVMDIYAGAGGFGYLDQLNDE